MGVTTWIRTNFSNTWLWSEVTYLIFLWTWIVTLIFFVKSIDVKAGEVNIFRIIYMALALLFIISFQFSRELWQVIVIRFWMILFSYAAFVCLSNLLFRFHNFGLNEQWRQDIGLLAVEMSELLGYLFVEFVTIAMVVVLRIVLREVNPGTNIKIGYLEKLIEILDTFFDITRLTIFGVMLACLTRVSAINFILLSIAVVSMVFRKMFRFIVILFISFSSALILLTQMITQLHYFQANSIIMCENLSMMPDINNWIGVGKLNPEESFARNVIGYICILALVTVHSIILKESSVFKNINIEQTGWRGQLMFNDRIYLDSNKSLFSYIIYILKYGFYHFGIEFTCIFMALLIYSRSDFWTLVYSLWLVIFVSSSNSVFVSIMWKFLKYFLVFVIPLQYTTILGLYLGQCLGHHLEGNNTFSNRAFQWLFFPMGNWRPEPMTLFWDSVVFLFALCQAEVFDFKAKYNEVEIAKMSQPHVVFLDTDPMIYRKTSFGLVRYVTFWLLPNLATTCFFLAATNSINIYSLLYGMCFVLILRNTDTYFTTSSVRTKQLWKKLLIANVLIIFVKICMQIPGCVFKEVIERDYRWLQVLFGISCLKFSENLNEQFLTWDVLCFIVMIFHDRFLRSPFYIGMAVEAELTKKFSFKAAKILRNLHAKELAMTHDKYERNLKKIRKNMKRLADAQKRLGGIKLREPRTHQEAVTFGDYYMFQDPTFKDIKCSVLESDVESEVKITDEEDEYQSHSHSPNIGTLIETVMKSDMQHAVQLAEATQTPMKPTSSREENQKDTITVLSKHTTLESSSSSSDSECMECVCHGAGKNDENTSQTPNIVIRDYKLQPTFNFGSKSREPHDANTDILQVNNFPSFTKNIVLSTSGEARTASNKTTKFPSGRKQNGSHVVKRPEQIRSFYNRGFMLVRLVKAFANGAMISLSQFFNHLARDHKYVMRQLEKAKHAQRGESLPRLKGSSLVLEKKKFSSFMRLLHSTHDLIMSRFSTVFFFSVLLAQIRNPTIYVFPLTIAVMVWGSLSVPRPSKLFYKTLLAYTMVLTLFDSIMRSSLIDDNSSLVAGNNTLKVNPFFTVEKNENFSIYYLWIILSIIWQRSMLRNLGLWDVEESPMTKWRGNVIGKFCGSVERFFGKLIYNTGYKIPVDVYTHMFFCDFVNIFIFIFGFASMTEKKEDGVSRYFSENKIPPALLLIFVIQCVAIFVDRWIYLRRNIKAKILFQFFQIVVVHSNLFIALPGLTLGRLNTMVFPTIWYCVKFTYFILSAYQIRNGYPSSVYGHALCQSYNVVNLYLYQIYLLFPFVYELRTVTDWMWTETTLTLTEWLGMEDIFSTVFVIKCWRNYDNKYSYQRGIKITKTVKVLAGGGTVLLFFVILLFPLAFFAFGHVTGKQNIPQNMELSFRIDSLQPIYIGYTEDVQSFTSAKWLYFQSVYEHSPAAFTFLSEYYSEDIGVVQFANYSIIHWTISPIARNQLIEKLKAGHDVQITAEWKLNRKTENHRSQTLVNGRNSVFLTMKQRNELLKVLNNTANRFSVNYLTPKFLKVSGFTTSTPVEVLTLESEDGEYVLISPFMTTTFEIDWNGTTAWWTATQHYYSYTPDFERSIDDGNPNNNIIIYTFNDKIFPPGIISYVSAQGILGLYTTFLISLGLLIRRMCRGRVNQIFLDYIPNVDCVLQLLLDIYFVRENGDGRLEEDLYAKLIFLFRSPETLIQWTRKPARERE